MMAGLVTIVALLGLVVALTRVVSRAQTYPADLFSQAFEDFDSIGTTFDFVASLVIVACFATENASRDWT